MFLAAFWSRSSTSPQAGHTWVRTLKLFCTRAPQPLQSWLVEAGSTNTTRLPAPRCLAREESTKLRPAGVRDGLGQMSVPHQVGDPQVFQIEGIVLTQQR